MNFGNLLYIQPENIFKNIRNIETTEKKLANAKIAVIFNNTCLNENLLPRFFNIYIYIYRYILIKIGNPGKIVKKVLLVQLVW